MGNKDKTSGLVRAAIEEIASDNLSGAAQILGRAAEVFSLLHKSAIESDGDLHQARQKVIETCAALIQAQPVMTPLVNLANSVVAAIDSPGAGEMTLRAEMAARKFSHHAARASASIARRAAELIPEGASVLTHSYSSTVARALIEAHNCGKRLSVIATESRPVFEGRSLASRLAGEGLPVKLIADSAAGLMMNDADLIFVGADTLTPEFIINKIGTRLVALAARERGLAVFALCDSSKFTASSKGLIETAHSREQLWPSAPDEIGVLNLYFEPTPLAYFSQIVTEYELLLPEEASSRALKMTIQQTLLDAI